MSNMTNVQIKISKAEIDFRKKIMETPGADKLMLCYQCGTCTADCPVALHVPEFRPRRIARLALFGQKNRLLERDTIWLCAGCYTCYERCPRQVRISEIVVALRKLAVREGLLHPTFKALMEGIITKGYIYEIGEFENEMREEEGLPPAPQPMMKEIEQIFEKTGFIKLLKGMIK